MTSACKARPKSPGGTIACVRPGTEAAALGLLPGDVIVSINGQPLRDVIDYQFQTADADVELQVQRDGSRFAVRLAGEGPPGIEFAELSFDGIRRCANRCMFCFVDQLPPSLRKSLYVKDDDYRYSVLYGNFVTLTNFQDEDWERIAEQHISPLHVSVHCTDPAVRRQLLGNRNAPEIVPQLRRLVEDGIQIHAQVVLCPGFNDGPVLESTVLDLVDLYPGVRTIGVVPVAVSTPRKPWLAELQPVDQPSAARVVAAARQLQKRCREKLGVGFVYLADEFFLKAGQRIPVARSYDGFPQYENGIGMVRSLKDGWARLRRRTLDGPQLPPRSIRVVCGRLIEPVLREILNELAVITNWSIDVVPVTNNLFGPNVTVSGLLSGRDILEALEGREPVDCLVLPRSSLDGDGSRFLDDLTPGELESQLGTPAHFAHDVKDLVEVSLQQSVR